MDFQVGDGFGGSSPAWGKIKTAQNMASSRPSDRHGHSACSEKASSANFEFYYFYYNYLSARRAVGPSA